MSYAELHCLSNFSFQRGASHADELVQRAKALGYAALAITDECSMAGIVRAHQAAQQAGIKLIAGTEVRLQDGTKLVLLAPDHDAYTEICGLITRGRRSAQKGEYVLTRQDLEHALAHVLALWVPGRIVIPAKAGIQKTDEPPLDPRFRGDDGGQEGARGNDGGHDGHDDWGHDGHDDGGHEGAATWVRDCFPGRAWIAAELHRGADDAAWLAHLRALGRHCGLPLVAAGDVHMHVRERRVLQDLLTAVRHGLPLRDCGTRLFPNGERHLRAPGELRELYPADLLDATLAIAQRCRFSLGELRYEYPHELVPPGETATTWLRKLTEDGIRERWPEGIKPKVRALIEKELALIAELKYEHFFLTVQDAVAFARSQGILCQGRGSAANSAVCYALGITEVDPARMNMLFERFVSKERDEPPDIDVDFEHQRREEVIQYLYGKYGRERAAIAATVICYRPRSAIRDVGKALGLAPDQVDRLSKSLAWWDSAEELRQRLRECGLDPDATTAVKLMSLVRDLQGFPRHLSQHVGGFVISELPLSQLVPVENAAMPERTIIQWDKDDLEALGLLKVDVLALGMLSALKRALEMLSRRRGAPFRMQDIPAEDPQTYAMIGRAETIGVFQIESRAQMSMLPRLRPECFYDLVIEVAIIRPGPIQGDMVHPYLRRRRGEEPAEYPSPALRRVLERTLGIPLFQEQVIEIAIVAAGFSPGEADQVRRSMAAWKRSGGLEPLERRLLEGMAKHGYSREYAGRIFEMIKGFGSYGFPESHAASFALLAYASAWLKRHEPAAFFAALLNSQPMGFYGPAQLVREAQRSGVEVRPPDVCVSDWDCALEEGGALEDGNALEDGDEAVLPSPAATAMDGGSAARGMDAEAAGRGVGGEGSRHSEPHLPGALAPSPSPVNGRGEQSMQPAIRLGLCLIKGLPEDAARRIVAARAQRPFAGLDDLIRRARIDARSRKALADADALRTLSGDRHATRWAALGIEELPGFLDGHSASEPALALRAPREGEDVLYDYRSIGLTLRRHPVALLRPRLDPIGVVPASRLGELPDGRTIRVAGLVINRQRPGTASGVVFMTLEDETGLHNLIVWPKVLERQRAAVLGGSFLIVSGKLQKAEGVIHLIAEHVHNRSHWIGQLPAASRDFH